MTDKTWPDFQKLRTTLHYHNDQQEREHPGRKFRQVGWIDNFDKVWDMSETNDCMHQEHFGNMSPIYIEVGID